MKQLVLNNLSPLSDAHKETLRGIRTNIQFCGDNVKTILFTSVSPDEGKSTVSFNVARAFADNDQRVLYIDTDIRKSVISSRLKAKTLDSSRILGLSHYLSGQSPLDDVIYQTNVKNLFVIFAGPSVPNATEIIDSVKFRILLENAKKVFDYVIVDSAPVTATIDASIIAKESDGVVIITEPEKDSTRIINRSKQQLESSGTRILGVILNKINMKKNSYYGKYYGSYYGKYYGDEKKKK